MGTPLHWLCRIFLQTCEAMSSPLESGDLPTVVVNPEASFEPVRDAILDLREKVEDLCNQELGKITKQGPPARLLIEFSPFYVFLRFILSSVPLQSTTQRCSHWETVSFQTRTSSICRRCVKTACFTLSSFLIQPTAIQDWREGF